jgi:hypothetical protein
MVYICYKQFCFHNALWHPFLCSQPQVRGLAGSRLSFDQSYYSVSNLVAYPTMAAGSTSKYAALGAALSLLLLCCVLK